MNYELYAEKKDKTGIEKLRANECICGGALTLKTEQLPSNKMFWFKCERCGKYTGWHSTIQDAVSDWNGKAAEENENRSD